MLRSSSPGWRAGLAAQLVIFCAASSRAQSICGTVYDPSGAVVAGARVLLMQDYVKSRESTSDARGNFCFAGLARGIYEVQVKQPRMNLFQQTVQVEDKVVRVYAVLPLARVVEEAEVSTDAAPGGRKGPQPQPAIRTGGNVEPPVALGPLRPSYPAGAVARGVEGSVILSATIRKDGAVGDVRVMGSPDPDLAEEAIRTVSRCHYRPAKLNGQSVDNGMVLVLDFHLR